MFGGRGSLRHFVSRPPEGLPGAAAHQVWSEQQARPPLPSALRCALSALKMRTVANCAQDCRQDEMRQGHARGQSL